jgi:hypothetical protein
MKRRVPTAKNHTPHVPQGAGAGCQKISPFLAEGEVFFLDISFYRTPLFRLLAAQKVRGVAPARHASRVP